MSAPGVAEDPETMDKTTTVGKNRLWPATSALAARPPITTEGTLARRRGLRRWQLGLALPLGLLLVWSLVAAGGRVDARLFTSPWGVVQAARDPVVRELLLDGVLLSLWRNVQGALLGLAAGLAFGGLLGLSPIARRVLGPSFHAFRQVATFAWLPLITAWLGLGEATCLLFIALSAFKPMAVNAERGFSTVPVEYLEVARVLNLGRWGSIRRVVLPAAVPALVAGAELGFIYAWLATIGVETLIAFTSGIGSVIREGQEQFAMDIVVLGIVSIAAIGFLLNRSVHMVGKRLLRYRELSA